MENIKPIHPGRTPKSEWERRLERCEEVAAEARAQGMNEKAESFDEGAAEIRKVLKQFDDYYEYMAAKRATSTEMART